MIWLKRLLLGVLGFVVLALAMVYLWGEAIIRRNYEAADRSIILTSRPEVLAEGERLAQVFGCYRGCHGGDMEGQVFVKTPLGDRIVAPNLTRAIERYSVDELEAIVRQGVKPDGTSVFGMPSGGFASLTDADLSAVLSFIRSYPEQGTDHGRSRFGLLARWLIIRGIVRPEAAQASGNPWRDGFEEDPLRLGEYLATNACSECHGLDLEGMQDFTPPLRLVKGYERRDFVRLMKDGAGLGGRDLGLMTEMAQNRFNHLKEEEVDALYQYLHSR